MEKVTFVDYITRTLSPAVVSALKRIGMKTVIKERLLFLLKYTIGFALLGWILARIDRRQMIEAMTDISLTVVVSILALTFVNLAVQFSRWKYLLQNHSSNLQSRDILPSFFAGFAFRLMIPGGHAEITKILLLPGKKNGKVFAFGIEKYFQTFIKVVLVLISLPLVFPDLRLYLWGLALLAAGSYFLLQLVLKRSFFQRLQEREVSYPKIFLGTLAFSLMVFVCLTAQYFLLLNEIHAIDVGSTALVVIFIWSAGLLPVSVSGLGVRENLAVFFLAQYGIPGYTAVGISLLVFFLNSIVPALGGIYFIMVRRHQLKEAGGFLRSVGRKLYPRRTDPLADIQPGSTTVMYQEDSNKNPL